ncbi:MAG: sigma-70 family RNA polymerase sigma factor [Deltaproteobacteria bacterium]|nr:sigma-70 family RNA polymerase sigma factor [Deltaproteobacteria bacterium]
MSVKPKAKASSAKSNVVYLKTPKKTNRRPKVKAAISTKTQKKAKKVIRDINYFQNLIISHQDHGMKLAWRFLKVWQVRMHIEEIRSLVGLALVEAATRFDPEKEVAFSTFFFYHLRGILLKEITRLVHDSKNCEYLPGSAFTISDEVAEAMGAPVLAAAAAESSIPDVILQEKEIARCCWKACASLDLLEKEVIYRHFVDDQSIKEIAKELHYCRCHISRVKSNAIKKLKRAIGRSSAVAELFNAPKLTNAKAVNINELKVAHYSGGRGRRKDERANIELLSARKLTPTPINLKNFTEYKK